MAKKNKLEVKQKDRSWLPGISHRGKVTIGVGIGLLVIGFWLLTFTDPRGQNWASTLSPFVIIGAYAVIGIGIIIPDPGEDKNQVN